MELPTQRVRRLSQALAESAARAERLRQASRKLAVDRRLRTQLRRQAERERRLAPVSPAPDEVRTLMKARELGLDLSLADVRGLTRGLQAISPTPQEATKAEVLGQIQGRQQFGTTLPGLPSETGQAGLTGITTALTTPPLPPSVQEEIRGFRPGGVPVGEEFSRTVLPITSPVGLLTTAVAPGLTLTGVTGAFGGGLAGAGLEEAGFQPRVLGIGPRTAGEIAGGVAGAGLEPAAARRIGTSLAEAGGVRALPGRVLAEEVGGIPVPSGRIQEGFIRGGRPPGQPPAVPTDPLSTLQQKLIRVSRLDKNELNRLVRTERRVENVERTAAYQRILREELDKGTSFDEAVIRARSALAGKRYDIVREGFEITPAEQKAFTQKLLEIPADKTYTLDNVYTAVWEGSAGRRLRDWEIKAIGEVFGPQFADAVGTISRKASRDSGFNAWQFTSDVLLAPVQFMSNFFLDFSQHLRQGWKGGLRYPRTWLSSMRADIQASFSEKGADRIDTMIRNDQFAVPVGEGPQNIEMVPFGELAQEREGMDLLRALPGSAEEADLFARDERVVSALLNKLPGIKQSSRGFVTAGNWQRSGIGKSGVRKAMARNKALTGVEFVTPDELRDIGDVARRLSGLGEIGGRTWVGGLIKHVQWAPGTRASLPQLVWRVVDPRGIVAPKVVPAFGRGTSPVARRMAAEALGTWFLAGTTAMGVALAAGWNVDVNPISTDFGSFWKPGTRTKYNLWGTDSILARQIARAVKGEGVDEFGNVRKITWDKALEEYFWSGANPIISDIRNIKAGRSFRFEYTGWNRQTAVRFMQDHLPLLIQDVREVVEEDGFVQGATTAPFQSFGGTTRVYGEESGRFRAIPKWNTGVLSANEERDIDAFLREVSEWEEKVGDAQGPPDRESWSFEKSIRFVGERSGKGKNFVDWAVALNRAGPEQLNPEWLDYLVEHEKELRDRYPDLYQANYVQEALQRKRELEGVR